MKIERTKYAIVCENRTKILTENRGYRAWRPVEKIGAVKIATWRSPNTALSCIKERSDWRWYICDKDFEVVEITETIDLGIDNE